MKDCFAGANALVGANIAEMMVMIAVHFMVIDLIVVFVMYSCRIELM